MKYVQENYEINEEIWGDFQDANSEYEWNVEVICNEFISKFKITLLRFHTIRPKTALNGKEVMMGGGFRITLYLYNVYHGLFVI